MGKGAEDRKRQALAKNRLLFRGTNCRIYKKNDSRNKTGEKDSTSGKFLGNRLRSELILVLDSGHSPNRGIPIDTLIKVIENFPVLGASDPF